MGELHRLIVTHGAQQARELAGDQAPLVDMAARILADETQAIGITYSGFCLTSLPHKRLEPTQSWERTNGRVSLLIEPGRDRSRNGVFTPVGVPFGARARLLLIYLQTRAIQDNSPEVELGKSMNNWLSRMGIAIGGTSYQAVREQANRISLCRLTFYFDNDQGHGFCKENIVTSGIRLHAPEDDDRQQSFWQDKVRLSDTFFAALRDHPVPVSETAIRALSMNSLALDAYVWLAYRLHSLSRPTSISWTALHSQFGGACKKVFHFRPNFRASLNMALAAYPDARVDITDAGLILHPSAPPVAENRPRLSAR